MDFGVHNSIEVRASDTDNWGPFSFDLEDSIPSGDTVASVIVKAYQGKKKPTSTYASPTAAGRYTDCTTLLVDSGYTPSVIGDYTIYVKFKYPGDEYKNEKFTIVFNVTTTAGGKYPFYFHSVNVK